MSEILRVLAGAESSALAGYKLQLAGKRSKAMANSTGVKFEEIRISKVGGSGVNRSHCSQSTRVWGGEDGRSSSAMGRTLASKSEKPHTCRIRIGSSDSRNR